MQTSSKPRYGPNQWKTELLKSRRGPGLVQTRPILSCRFLFICIFVVLLWVGVWLAILVVKTNEPFQPLQENMHIKPHMKLRQIWSEHMQCHLISAIWLQTCPPAPIFTFSWCDSLTKQVTLSVVVRIEPSCNTSISTHRMIRSRLS